MAIHVLRISKTEQVFTHQAEDGTIRHFAVERLFNYMKGVGREVYSIWLEPAYVNTIFLKRGVETHRLNRITREIMEIPVLYLEGVSPGTHLLADGNHRYVARARAGFTDLPAYVAEPKLWKRFMVEGIPDAMVPGVLTGFSNIH